MNLPELKQLYAEHKGKVSDKWSLYLDAYDDILAPYRNAPVQLLEIGIQNGGSLEIWAHYFKNGRLFIGCDINEACRALTFDDPRIQLVIGDASSEATAEQVFERSEVFDIVLDDGSHRSGDIVTAFARYFPALADGGLYAVEDLHCSYWGAFEGGLFDPTSSMSFFKHLADVIQHEHWGVPANRAALLAPFRERYGCSIDEDELACVYSVEFRNSLCLIRKRAATDVELGPRIVVGETSIVASDMLALRGTTHAATHRPDESANPWSNIGCPPDQELKTLRVALPAAEQAAQAARQQAQHEKAQAAAERAESVRQHASAIAALQAEHARKAEANAFAMRSVELAAHQKQQELNVLSRAHERLGQRLRVAQEERAALLASRTWKIASALQKGAQRMPRLTRLGWQLAKGLRLVSTMQFRRIARGALSRYRSKAVAAAVAGSGLFDDKFYLATYPDVAGYAGGPLRHYVLLGGLEGRHPNPLFDGQLYLGKHPEILVAGENPIVHYLHHPELNPNRYFDGFWYLNQNPDIKAAGLNPLRHYIEHGAAEGRDPSSRFSTRWYVDRNPDIAASGINPLAHFLLHGESEGRSPSPEAFFASSGASVTRSEIHCLKVPAAASEMALFVAHSPDGKLKPHVLHYLHSLQKAGIAVVLLVAADTAFVATEEIADAVSGIFVRRNEGYDFAAWAHVLKLRPDFLDSDILYLLNDSLIGPFGQPAFEDLLSRVRQSPAALIGMTANHERTGWHLQSFFLALKRNALGSVAFQSFFNRVTTLEDKDDVINQYELRFAPSMQAEGILCEALFEPTGPSNPTIYEWKELIGKGMPFVKVMVLRDRFENVDVSDWEQVLGAQGFDTTLAARTLEEARRPQVPPVRSGALVRQPSLPFEAPPRKLKIALIAPWNFDNGLGVAARSYISALRHAGVLLNLHPVKRPFHVHRQVAPPFDVCDFSGDADVAIVQVNPDGWDNLLTEAQVRVIQRARCRIGAWVWETPEVPSDWLDVMKRVDAVWAPSQYCADAFSHAVAVPVHVVPYVVAPGSAPEAGNPRSTLASLGIGTDEKIVLYAFDGSSYLVRKNPMALIEAFGRSGLRDSGWKLVLKTKHVNEESRQGRHLMELVKNTPGVLMLNQSLDKNAMRQLMQCASIYASPHSAEGFGLTVAEAMAMGKLVVATDFSATRDFLDSSCGFPVKYHATVLDEAHGAYESGVAWASIDVGLLTRALIEAAGALKRGDLSLGDAARLRVKEQLSAVAVAHAIHQSLQVLQPQLASTTPREVTP